MSNISRSEISEFLKSESGKQKPSVLADFIFFCTSKKVDTETIGKLIKDLRSYPEWTWGE